MPKYKPMLIHFDEQGYKIAGKQAMEKIVVFNDAKRFAEKHIVVGDSIRFAESFTTYFKQQFLEKNKSKIQLDISVDKLLYLMEIDLTPLLKLEEKYRQNDSVLSFDSANGIPAPIIDKSQFEVYTNSSEQNAVLRDVRKLIEQIEVMANHTKVYPLNLVQGFSNLISFDMTKQKYSPNLHSICNYGKTQG